MDKKKELTRTYTTRGCGRPSLEIGQHVIEDGRDGRNHESHLIEV